MKSTIIIGLIISLAVLATITSAEEETIFQRTFNQLHTLQILHNEPPPPALVRSSATVRVDWIEQKLDHFNDTEKRTWKMRYISNDEFYQEGGPLFIFVGGEWNMNISKTFIGTGLHIYAMAEEHHGYLFNTEHRYYGESKPTSDISNENIKYLNVRQALADLAHFIRTMKATKPGMSDSKVILLGGSYSGTMVTWFKKLYPDLATGCWASSAPLLAKVDFEEYNEIVGQSIRLVGGADCYERIEKGIAEMESMFANKRGAEVKAMLQLCNNFDESNDLDIWTLFSEISAIFAGVVQTHNGSNIQSECAQIMQGDDHLNGLTNYLLAKFGSKGCSYISYKATIGTLIHSAYSHSTSRQWMYQTCNEFGWFQTSRSSAQPFGTKFPVELYTKICHDVFGEKYTKEFINKQIDETNAFFNGLNIEVENVYITHGQLDPWRAMGIQDENRATIIPLHAHCKDFGSISSRDTPELRSSKEKIASLVREWVNPGASDAVSVANKASKLMQKLRN